MVKDKIKRNEYNFTDNEEKDKVIENALSYEPDYVESMISDETIDERAMIILSSLNDNEKALYLAHYIDKKNLKEIADDIGISHTAVRQRHVELKKKIVKKIKEYEKT
jgi:RNA polymerase sigma factor (sigma-70 family)